jgi:DNA polymerase alpha subunit A
MICPHCSKLVKANAVALQVSLVITAHINKYYQGWIVCDDTSCRNRTRQFGVYGSRCLVKFCRGSMVPEV